MRGADRKKRRAGERGGEVRLPHSKFLDPLLNTVTLAYTIHITSLIAPSKQLGIAV